MTNTFQTWGTHIQCSQDPINFRDDLWWFWICIWAYFFTLVPAWGVYLRVHQVHTNYG